MISMERMSTHLGAMPCRSADGRAGGGGDGGIEKHPRPVVSEGNLPYEKSPYDPPSMSYEKLNWLKTVGFEELLFAEGLVDINAPLERTVLDRILDACSYDLLAKVQITACNRAMRFPGMLRDTPNPKRKSANSHNAASPTVLDVGGRCMQRVFTVFYLNRDNLFLPKDDGRQRTYRDLLGILGFICLSAPKLVLSDIDREDYPLGIPKELFSIWRRVRRKYDDAVRRGEDPWKEAKDWLMSRKRPNGKPLFTEDEADALKTPPEALSTDGGQEQTGEDQMTGIERVDSERARSGGNLGDTNSIDQLGGVDRIEEESERWLLAVMRHFLFQVRPAFRMKQKIDRLRSEVEDKMDANTISSKLVGNRDKKELDLELHEIELTRINRFADLPRGQWNRKRLELLEQAGLPATYAKIMSRYYSDCEGITGDKGIRLARAIVRKGQLDIFADHETSLRQICEDLGVPSRIEHLLRVHFGRKDNT